MENTLSETAVKESPQESMAQVFVRRAGTLGRYLAADTLRRHTVRILQRYVMPRWFTFSGFFFVRWSEGIPLALRAVRQDAVESSVEDILQESVQRLRQINWTFLLFWSSYLGLLLWGASYLLG